MGIAEERPRTEPAGGIRDPIGLAIEDLPTPSLLLDVASATKNIGTMAERLTPLPTRLRPHVKAHKSAELARLQLAHGAIGVTTATVAEADAMADAGVPDILIANEVVAPASVERLVAIAPRARITVAIDDRGNLEALAAAAHETGVVVGVVVELDVGMGRGGARSVEDARALARTATDLRGVELRGLLGYEGHCADEPDPLARERETRASMALLTEAAASVREDGLPVEIVSAGATGTYGVTGSFPGVTEVQAGSYVLMDGYHAPLAPEFGSALFVAATAISVHGDLAVYDAGRKALGSDFGPPASPDPRGVFAFIHEEHAGFRYPGGGRHRVGDRVAFVPVYAPTTVNLFGTIHVTEEGRVTDVWRVLARHGDA